jgi:NAD(P) transhydrogenase subunit alpha
MMMTPSGTISPAKVFVIGAGVAGLQAIATAKRLGARVEAFDTRPVVEEQVQSLGAKFLKVDLGVTSQTKDGYAKALTKEQLAIQRAAMAKAVAQADVTITTAKLFGRKAPILITADMLKEVKPGSVIVDLAAGSGGNVEGIVADEEVQVNGVHLIGIDNLSGKVAINASEMFAANMVNLLTHLRDEETGLLDIGAETVTAEKAAVADGVLASHVASRLTHLRNSEAGLLDISTETSPAEPAAAPDEIVAGCVVVRGGVVVNPEIKKFYEGDK